MSVTVESMISAVLSWLKEAGDEGLTTNAIFENLESKYGAINDATKADFWAEFVKQPSLGCRINGGRMMAVATSPLAGMGLSQLLSRQDVRKLYCADEKLLQAGDKRQAVSGPTQSPDISPDIVTTETPVQQPAFLLQQFFASRATPYISPYAPTPTSQSTAPTPLSTKALGHMEQVKLVVERVTAEATSQYVHNDATVWAEVLSPQAAVQSEPTPSPAAVPKNRKPRKRRPLQQDQGGVAPPMGDAQLLGPRKRKSVGPSPQEPPTQRSRPNPRPKEEMVAKLAHAEAVVPPEGSTRLACIFNGAYGNLILTKDLSRLEFIQDVQPVSATPMLVLPIGKVGERPITSTKGSNPMELRIKAIQDHGPNITYCFTFVDTGVVPESLEPAHLMRHKMITAMLSLEFGEHGIPAVGANDDDLNLDSGAVQQSVTSTDGQHIAGPADVQQNLAQGPVQLNLEESQEPTKLKRKYNKKPVIPETGEKGYKCSKCGKLYGQSWGLSYHLTKSTTLCNPNADLELYEEKRQRREKRMSQGTYKKSTTTSKEVLPQDSTSKPLSKRGRPRKETAKAEQTEEASSSKQGEPHVNDTEEPTPRKSTRNQSQVVRTPKKDSHPPWEEAEQSDSSSDSLDSLVEFYQGRVTTGVERPSKASFGRTPIATPSKKMYKALPFESSVLQELAEHMAASTISEDASPFEASASVETGTTSDSLASQKREEIILFLLRENEGIFPGDKSIWIASAGEWLNKFPRSTILPESKLCSQSIDQLIETKKIRSVEFSWIDSKKREFTRTILILLGSKIKSPAIEGLKSMIQQAYPNIYVPSHFAPPEPILSRLNELALRKVSPEDKARFRAQESADAKLDSESRSQSPMQLDDETSSDDFKAGEAEEEEPLEDELDDPDGWQDEELDFEEDEKPKRKRKGKKKGDKWSRQRSPGHNKAIAEGVRRNWEKRKASQTNNFFPNRRNRPARKPMTKEEKAKRIETVYLNQRSWGHEPAFLPNPATGAWDQAAKPKKNKKGKPRKIKPKLPAPITFMQAENGAWSLQPYGHGAPPVFARPLRRADEEGNYLKRVGRDHRPVIFPTKNRMMLPANPPRALLEGREISKITGKPKRQYIRKGQPRPPKPKVTRKARVSKATGKKVRSYQPNFPFFVPDNGKSTKKRGKKGINEVDILNFFEPKKLLPDAQRNIGLASIPPVYGLNASLYQGPSSVVHDYRPNYQNLVFIAPSVITGGEDPNRGSWTVSCWRPAADGRLSLQWEDSTAFDMETLPFRKLDFGRDDHYRSIRKKPAPKGRGKPRWSFIPPAVLTKEGRLKYSRVLTALPTDFKGLLKDPQDATKQLGVQLAEPNRAVKNNRRIKGTKAMLSERAEKRFMVTVVVIRTLTGGLSAVTDWVLVSQCFQDYTCNFLMKYWNSLRGSKKPVIDRMVEDFQKLFTKAYKKKQVPQIDYNRLTEVRWRQLVKWTMKNKNISTSMVKKQKKLPDSRKQLAEKYDIEASSPDPHAKNWRDQYASDKTALYKKMDMAVAQARVIPQKKKSKKSRKELSEEEFRLIRTWVRAVALTPDEDFDKKVAETKLLSLVDKQKIKQVTAELQEDKVFLKASRTRRFFGCVFEVTGKFLEALNKIDVPVEQFVDAAMTKWVLDQRFWQGDECVRHEYICTDGAVTAVTSMQARGAVRLWTSQWPSEGKKLGVLEGGGYETKNIPKDNYKFNIDVYPTDTYLYDSDNAVLQKFLQAEPPHGSSAGELPIWWGITGKLNRDIWKRTLCSVGAIMSNRASSNIKGLMEHFSPTFEEWELRLLMNWGTELEFFTRVHPTIEGWNLGEWWWLMAAKVCDDGIPCGKGK